MPHGDFHPIAFIVVAVWVLACGVGVVAFRNIVHSAISMIACFLGVAAVYVLLNSGLLAIIQLLLYVGAISIVVLFAIMMTERPAVRPFGLYFNRQSIIALPLAVAAAVLLTVVLVTSKMPPNGSASHNVSLSAIATGLFKVYLFPFELVSFVLLAAMVGAIVMARREDDE